MTDIVDARHHIPLCPRCQESPPGEKTMCPCWLVALVHLGTSPGGNTAAVGECWSHQDPAGSSTYLEPTEWSLVVARVGHRAVNVTTKRNSKPSQASQTWGHSLASTQGGRVMSGNPQPEANGPLGHHRPPLSLPSDLFVSRVQSCDSAGGVRSMGCVPRMIIHHQISGQAAPRR